jgi:hypothetical protein
MVTLKSDDFYGSHHNTADWGSRKSELNKNYLQANLVGREQRKQFQTEESRPASPPLESYLNVQNANTYRTSKPQVGSACSEGAKINYEKDSQNKNCPSLDFKRFIQRINNDPTDRI